MALDPAKTLASTMISKRDYGIKIAKRGYDVNYASDTELLYNSSFPVLAIANYITNDTPREVLEEGEISTWSDYDGSYYTEYVYRARVLHGLDYVPLVVRTNYDRFNLDVNNNFSVSFNWDNKYVYVDYIFYSSLAYSNFVSGGRVINISLLVFAVNIEIDVEYPYFDYAVDKTEWGSSNDYGMKYILAGSKDNLNLEDLGMNPNIQSLMVTAVKVCKDTVKTQYAPVGIDFGKLSAFCCVRVNNKWQTGEVTVVGKAGYKPINNGDGTGYYDIDGTSFGDMVSLVVTRMPFIAPDKFEFSMDM